MQRVEYDIYKSNYRTKINKYELYFSSDFNRRRFENNFYLFIEEEHNKLKSKYHVNLNIYDYLLIVFYKRIEKRGFRVLVHTNNGIIELKEDYIFKIS